MMTPRPHARTRRAAASLTIAAVGLLALAGCDPRTLLYFLQPFEPTVPPPCHAKFKGKKVVILAHAVSGTQTDFQALDREIAREVGKLMTEKVKKVEVVPLDKVWAWMEGHPDWTDPAEAAKAFEADFAIFLEIEAFQVANPSSPGLLEGNAKTHIQAFELDYPKNSKGKPIKDQEKESKVIYDDYRDTTFPVRGPIPVESGVSKGAFKTKFLQVVAAEISWHFVEHSPEDDIQDGRVGTTMK
jgi:hypothetical protein